MDLPSVASIARVPRPTCPPFKTPPARSGQRMRSRPEWSPGIAGALVTAVAPEPASEGLGRRGHRCPFRLIVQDRRAPLGHAEQRGTFALTEEDRQRARVLPMKRRRSLTQHSGGIRDAGPALTLHKLVPVLLEVTTKQGGEVDQGVRVKDHPRLWLPNGFHRLHCRQWKAELARHERSTGKIAVRAKSNPRGLHILSAPQPCADRVFA